MILCNHRKLIIIVFSNFKTVDLLFKHINVFKCDHAKDFSFFFFFLTLFLSCNIISVIETQSYD